MTEKEQVQVVLDKIRPNLQADGGEFRERYRPGIGLLREADEPRQRAAARML